MSIYLRGKSYYYDFFFKTRRYAGCIGPVSRSMAKEEEARKRVEIIEGRLNPAKLRKTPRFDEFSKEYLDWVRTNRKPLTYRQTQVGLKPLGTMFNSKKLNEISAWHMEQYKRARKEANCAPSTINNEIILLKSMLNKALSWGKLTEHPGREVKLLKVVKEKARFLSEEEEHKLLAACSPYLRCIVETGLLTGFRPRELTSLRPADVDVERNLVTVAACYAKNGESRTLPMGPKLKTILQTALIARGNASTVFTTCSGKPWGSVAYGVRFLEASKQAGILPCGPHILRHTFASRLVMAGVDLRTVQELMGHKDIKQTMRYSHLSPQHKQSAMETLETRVSGKSPIKSPNTPLHAHPVSLAKTA